MWHGRVHHPSCGKRGALLLQVQAAEPHITYRQKRLGMQLAWFKEIKAAYQDKRGPMRMHAHQIR